MNVLVVYTHPNRESLNGSFLEKAVEGLELNKSLKKIEVLDLYQDNFNPALVFNSEKKRRDMATVPSLAKYRDQITNADVMVFIYPIWWGRPPAMLLGYIDQLFTTNFAYKKEEGKMMPTGLLTGKKVFCISTMNGPKGYLRLLYSNVHQVLMKKNLFNFVGIKKVKFLEFGSMEKKGGNQGKYLDKVKDIMEKI